MKDRVLGHLLIPERLPFIRLSPKLSYPDIALLHEQLIAHSAVPQKSYLLRRSRKGTLFYWGEQFVVVPGAEARKSRGLSDTDSVWRSFDVPLLLIEETTMF